MKAVCVVVLVLAALWDSGRSAKDGPQETGASTVHDRLDRLERLLNQQQLTTARQERLLRQQEEKLAGQRNLLRRQDSQLLHQDKRLRQQDSLLRHQDKLLRQQKAKLSHQSQLWAQYTQDLQRLRDPSQVEPRTLSSPEPTTHRGNNVTSTPHHAVPRAADTQGCEGPCNAVLSQIGQHVLQVEAEVRALRDTVPQPQSQGSTYVHWGASYCGGNASELVYSGVMGGAPWNHPGAATNFLCLTMEPVFSTMDPPSERAVLYGAQYDTDDSHDGYDPVCTVCRSRYLSTLMIPGTDVCSHGWDLLYSGYLMAGDFTKASGSQFVCVDSLMDSRPLSGDDRLGKLLTYTVTQCGSSLPCGPYLSHKVVTCAVCGK